MPAFLSGARALRPDNNAGKTARAIINGRVRAENVRLAVTCALLAGSERPRRQVFRGG